MFIDSIVFMVLNKSYSADLVKCFPVVSREISLFRFKLLPYLICMVVFGFMEACFLSMISYYYVSHVLLPPGYVTSIEVVTSFLGFSIFINAKIKLLLVVTKFTTKLILFQFITPCMIVLFIFGSYKVLGEFNMEYVPVNLLFRGQIIVSCLVFGILAWTLITLYFTQWLKYHLFYKYFNHEKMSKKVSTEVAIKKINKNFFSALKFVYRLTTEELLITVKKITSKQMVEKALSKLMYTDPTSQRSGLSKYMNQIIDRTERKRFFKYYMHKSRRGTRGILSISIVLIVGEYIIDMIDNGTFNLQIHTGIPIMILLLGVALVCSMMRNKQYFIYYSLLIAIGFSVPLTLILIILNPDFMFPPRNTTLRRLVFSSIPLTLHSSFAIGFCLEVLRLTR